MDLTKFIRDIKDFPKAGIVFKDITPLLSSAEGFKSTITQLRAKVAALPIDVVVGIEARGFIFGAALALEMGLGFVPIRKPGKLPADTVQESYDLEYGSSTIEIHRDGVHKGQRVLIVDDVLATGGTLAACLALVRLLGAEVRAVAVLIEIESLRGRSQIQGVPVFSVLRY